MEFFSSILKVKKHKPSDVIPNQSHVQDWANQVHSFGFQNNKNWQKQQYQRNRWNRGGHPPIKNRDASVTVRPEWKVIEEMDFPRLSKLSLPNIDDPKDLWVYGVLRV